MQIHPNPEREAFLRILNEKIKVAGTSDGGLLISTKGSRRWVSVSLDAKEAASVRQAINYLTLSQLSPGE